MTATQTAHSSVDARTLLAELGSANSETTEQLLAAATELAASIVERLKLTADASPIFAGYRVVDSRLYWDAEFVECTPSSRTAPPSPVRKASAQASAPTSTVRSCPRTSPQDGMPHPSP